MSKIKEPVPDAWKEGKLPYGPSITLATAKKMLDAAEAKAKKQGLLMVIAVADTGGNLVAFSRMDNAMLLSIQIAMDKAFTAAFSKVPSEVWRNILRAGMLPQLFIHERLMPLPGGFPLIKNGQLMGGLGVSGATALGDTSVARAALVAGGFNTQDIDAMLVELQGT
jgi:glc operon protein GlcG